jgi:hypothetical protein
LTLLRRSIFISASNPAEQHNAATREQDSEANKLIQRTSQVLFYSRSFKVDCLSVVPRSYKFPL